MSKKDGPYIRRQNLRYKEGRAEEQAKAEAEKKELAEKSNAEKKAKKREKNVIQRLGNSRYRRFYRFILCRSRVIEADGRINTN